MDLENTLGPETVKAIHNFGEGKTPRILIQAYAQVKQAALMAVQETCSPFTPQEFEILLEVLQEIQQGAQDELFRLNLFQGGAGTSLHMNLNEAVAQLGQKKLSALGINRPFNPIEEINLFQSTNDTFTTAVTILAYRGLVQIEKGIIQLQEVLTAKERTYESLLITGRTELQDALPMTLGQIFAGWSGSIERDRWRVSKVKERLRSIALGGTAIGTGLGAPQEYVFSAEKHLRQITGLPLSRSQNLVDEISNLDKFSEAAGVMRLFSENLIKISGDLLYYTSAPVGELEHPNLQAGSTFMPAKTNPVLLELVQGLAFDTQGECFKISLYTQNGKLQLNPFLPFLCQSLLNIFDNMNRALEALNRKLLPLLEVNEHKIQENLSRSPALLNALAPILGYDRVKTLLPQLEAQPPANLQELKLLLIKTLGVTDLEAEKLLSPQNLTTRGKAI